jgi:hypothetical protein
MAKPVRKYPKAFGRTLECSMSRCYNGTFDKCRDCGKPICGNHSKLGYCDKCFGKGAISMAGKHSCEGR